MKISYKKPTLAWFAARKPYQNKNLNYDAHYFKVLEEIVGVLHKNIGHFIDIEMQYEIAFMLTGYLEDFICEIGMWQAIRENNKKIYGCAIPIFLNNTKSTIEYSEEDINLEDICLLIWYNLSKTSNEIYCADNENIWRLAGEILDVINKYYDNLPATTYYDKYLTIKQSDDWGELKGKLNWFAFYSPFIQYEANQKLKELNENSKDNNDEFSQIEPIMNHESVLFNTGMGWHGHIINEMFADVCRCDEKTKVQIRNFSKRDIAIYYLKSKDSKNFNFINTYINQQYLVPVNSIVQPTPLGLYYYAGFVKWGDNWELNGVLFGGWKQHGIPDPLNEKFQHNFYYYVPEYQNMIDKTLSEQHNAFLATFNGNFAIANNNSEFLKNLKKYDENYFDMIVKSKTISKIDYVKNAGIASRTKYLFPQNANLSMFFNKRSGIEYIYDLPNLKSLLLKNYEDLSKNEILEILSLLMENTISANFVKELGEKNGLQNIYRIFKIKSTGEFQFILRFYKPDDFRTRTPLLALADLCVNRWDFAKYI